MYILLFCLTALTASVDQFNFKKINIISKSAFIFFLFVAYFSFSLIYDGAESAEVRAITIGSTGGILFGYLTGRLSFLAINSIFISTNKTKMPIEALIVLFIFVVVLLYLQTTYTKLLENSRLDLFLTAERDFSYQRVGSYLFIQFIVCGTLVALHKSKKIISLKLKLVYAFFISANAAYSMLLSQLLGSNSGFYTIILFFLLIIAYLFLGDISASEKGEIIKGKFIYYYAKKTAEVLFISGLIIFLILDNYNVDLSRFRAFGFGEGVLSTFTSRSEIFKNYLFTHLSYSPFLGNTKVDQLTTGIGTYVHSIPISILTHLGIVGFIIFILLNYFALKEILSKKQKPQLSGFKDQSFILFKSGAFIFIFLLGSFSAFFTWLPYWFALGLYQGKLFSNKSMA